MATLSPPPPTITALGDSLTQGFQHGAIRRPEWAFPAMIARSFGHGVPDGHRVPDFGKLGYPVDLEQMIVDFEQDIGDTLETLEWLLKLPEVVRARFDSIEDYYERGSGSAAAALRRPLSQPRRVGVHRQRSDDLDAGHVRGPYRLRRGLARGRSVGRPLDADAPRSDARAQPGRISSARIISRCSTTCVASRRSSRSTC